MSADLFLATNVFKAPIDSIYFSKKHTRFGKLDETRDNLQWDGEWKTKTEIAQKIQNKLRDMCVRGK